MADTEEDEDARFPDPAYVIYAWRYEQARKLGLGISDAERFAVSDADIGQLRDLIAQRCDPHTACEIVS